MEARDSAKKVRPKSSKSTPSERSKARGLSPYSANYKVPIPHCQRHLINQHLVVTKLSRTDLEDRYLELCDENFRIKHGNRELESKLKMITTRALRASSAGAMFVKQFKSVDGLSQSSKENDEDETNPPRINNPLRVYNNRLTAKFLTLDPGKAVREQNFKVEIEKIKTEKQEIYFKMCKLEEKCKELDFKIFEETKKLVSAMMESKSNKRKAEKYEMQAKHLREEKRELERQIESFQDDLKDMNALKKALKEQKDRNEELTRQISQIESDKKLVVDLKEEIIQLEMEKNAIRVQQENLSKLMDESVSTKALIEELDSIREKLKAELCFEKAEKDALKDSQVHLISKLKALQNLNDSLSIANEGLKGKLDYFSNENISLELRLRDSERELRQLETHFRKNSIKDLVLNKLSSVTFEAPEEHIVKTPLSSSRRSSLVSLLCDPNMSLASMEEVPPSNVKIVTANLHATDISKLFSSTMISSPASESLLSRKEDESDLNSSFLQRIDVQYRKFSLNDTIVDESEEIEEELSASRDSVSVSSEIIEQAEIAAQKLIIKSDFGTEGESFTCNTPALSASETSRRPKL